MIGIIDYEMGNLRSVQKAFERLGTPARICSTPADLQGIDGMVLPGVGAFRDAIAALKHKGFVGPIRDHVAADIPFLGICLGLQLLFDVSYEDGEHEGLGIVPGHVERFVSQPGLKIPHMGWNSLDIARSNPLLDEIPSGEHVYFVHSYHVVPEDDAVIAARADHGGPFVAMIAWNQLYATQFHPEKSQSVGMRLLDNFAKQVAAPSSLR
ncbi:MAG: imidazole glycerol phosphate synthase subunit HisH [Planctomycetaceae bacterium]